MINWWLFPFRWTFRSYTVSFHGMIDPVWTELNLVNDRCKSVFIFELLTELCWLRLVNRTWQSDQRWSPSSFLCDCYCQSKQFLDCYRPRRRSLMRRVQRGGFFIWSYTFRYLSSWRNQDMEQSRSPCWIRTGFSSFHFSVSACLILQNETKALSSVLDSWI